jgi:hypothetical protein
MLRAPVFGNQKTPTHFENPYTKNDDPILISLLVFMNDTTRVEEVITMSRLSSWEALSPTQ